MGRAANATPKERQAMSASIFCGPNRTFPIEDQGDVDSAAKLIGKAKDKGAVIACIKRKAKKNNWSYPKSWDEAKMSNIATFSLPKGWTYEQLRSFLQSELMEDKPALPKDDDSTNDIVYYYPMLRDLDDAMVVFSDDFDDDLFQCTYTITQSDSGKDVTWGDVIEVGAVTSYVPIAEMSDTCAECQREHSVAAFSSDMSDFTLGDALNVSHDDWVVRSGVLFEAGEFPDKAEEYGLESLVVSGDDLKTMVETFSPVENRVSHVNGKDKTPTIFDDHMGRLESVWVDESGEKLYGTIRIPKFLDDFQKKERGGGPLQASLEFDIVTKQIVGNTIVPNPRIETTALMSACAAFTKRNAPKETEKSVGKTEEQNKNKEETISLAEFAAMKARNEANEKKIAEMARVQREKDARAFAAEQLRKGRFPASARDYLIATFTVASEDDESAPKTINFSVGDKTATANRVQTLEAMVETIPALLTREFVPGQDNIVIPFSDNTEAQKQDAEAAKAAKAFVERQIAAQAQNGR